MNVPNKLTVSRILLTFVFMLLLFSHGMVYKCLALVTFVVASLTDVLDGYIAKKWNMITDFGTLMDPIADKVLVMAAFLAFVEMRLVPAWMAVIIILRELIITGIRVLALKKGKVLAADTGGKHKMVSQVIAILCVLIFVMYKEAGSRGFQWWSASTESVFRQAILVIMSVTVLLTIVSGVDYLVRNRSIYRNQKAR